MCSSQTKDRVPISRSFFPQMWNATAPSLWLSIHPMHLAVRQQWNPYISGKTAIWAPVLGLGTCSPVFVVRMGKTAIRPGDYNSQMRSMQRRASGVSA